MQLIGMLDSPYVRRVAISLQLLGLPFEHQSLSVFRTFAQFQQINPVVKAPTLVCDDGTLLMDSTLILEYAEALAAPRRTLVPCAPAEKQHEPWMQRVAGQLQAAFGALEADLQQRPLAAGRAQIDQAGVTVAVAWHFTQQTLPGIVDAAGHPALQEFSAQAEAQPEFTAAPHGDGTVRHAG